jgi:hypothetical protein
MTFIVAAVIGKTAVDLYASNRASAAQAKGARRAGEATAAASREAVAEQRRQYERTRADMLPQVQAGNRARNVMEIMQYGDAYTPPQQSQYMPAHGGGSNYLVDGHYGSDGYSGGFSGFGTGGYGAGYDGGYGGDPSGGGYSGGNPGGGGYGSGVGPTTAGSIDYGALNLPSRDFEDRMAPDNPNYLRPDLSEEAFRSSPSYEFQMNEAVRAAGATASATGGDARVRREMARYASGLASTDYDNWFNRTLKENSYMNELTRAEYGEESGAFWDQYNADKGEYGDYFNRTAGIATGGAQTNSILGQIGANTARGIASTTVSGGVNAGNAALAAGTAQASGYIGMANALTGGANFGMDLFEIGQNRTSSVDPTGGRPPSQDNLGQNLAFNTLYPDWT